MPGLLQAMCLIGLVLILHVPLGDWMARQLEPTPGSRSRRHLRVERIAYRVCGVDPAAEQTAGQYLLAMLAFSTVSIAALFLLLRTQAHLPGSRGVADMPWPTALNTAVSFTTNTSWQNYVGESGTGHLAVMAGLGVQAFASAAVGLCVALALVRGLVRQGTVAVGNFWVDFVRVCTRVLLPLAVVSGAVLIALGVPQNLGGAHTVSTLAGGHQTLIGGPIGSWEPIKLFTGDGGGFFNANSAHPYENPTAAANLLEILLMLLIPAAFIRTYGRMVGSLTQSWTLLVVVGILFALLLSAATLAQQHSHSPVPLAVGGTTEGTETRFGIPGSTLFGVSATGSADGAANSSYGSFSGLGGGVLMAAMMLGEIAPGGAGSGLYGLLIAVLIAVFIGGLMVGRTPEYLGKRIGIQEMRWVVLYTLVTPTVILTCSAVALARPAWATASMSRPGPHGLSELIYAYTSNAASNGSAMVGFNGATTFHNLLMVVAMLIGRYLPMVFVMALARDLARQRHSPVTVGTLRPTGVNFVTLVTGSALVLALLNFLPALALGPLAEGLA